MKKTLLRLFALLLALLMQILLFAACNSDKSTDENSDEATVENTDVFSSETTAATTEAPDDTAPVSSYELSYTSYGDGTCCVSGITFAEDAKDVAVIIPQTSPAGDTVVAYDSLDLSYQIIPLIISAEAFHEKIEKPILASIEAGALGGIPAGQGKTAADNFYFRKFTSYFSYQDLSQVDKVDDQEKLIAKYPLVQATSLRVFCDDATEVELRVIVDYLVNYTDYTAEDHKKDTQALLELGKQNNIENYDKGITLPTSSSLYSITFPDTLTQISPRAFAGCTNLHNVIFSKNLQLIGDAAFSYCKQLNLTEYKNGIYLGTADNPYFALIDIPNAYSPTYLHDQTVTLTMEAAKNLEKPADQTTVIDAITYIGTTSNPYLVAMEIDTTVNTNLTIAPTCRILVMNTKFIPNTPIPYVASITFPANTNILLSNLFVMGGFDINYQGTETQWNTLMRANNTVNNVILSPTITVHLNTESTPINN